MSFFIAGKISTETVLERGSRSPDLVGDRLTAFRSALCTNHGLTDQDLSLYVIADTDPVMTRIKNGDEYSVVWDESEIVSLDFTPEDDKPYLQFSANKTYAQADGVESVLVSVKALTVDKSQVDTNINGREVIACTLPGGGGVMAFTFSDGRASKSITSTAPGTAKFGGRTRSTGFRNDNEITVEFDA